MERKNVLTAEALVEPALLDVKKFLAACLRLMKPGISFFIGLTSATAVLVRPAGEPLSWEGGLLLFLGSFFASSGAAAFNQFHEADLDALMERTRSRPLPAKLLSPAFALIFSLCLLFLGLGCAFVFVHPYAALYLGLGAFSYIVLYTMLAKRRTAWNVPLGGLCGFFAALAGASSSDGAISVAGWGAALILYFWSAPHFWSLALLKAEDYAKAGVPMAPRAWGVKTTTRLILGHAILLPFLAGFFYPERLFAILFICAASLVFILYAWNLNKSVSIENASIENASIINASGLNQAARLEANFSVPAARKSFLFSLFFLPLVFLGFWIDAWIVSL